MKNVEYVETDHIRQSAGIQSSEASSTWGVLRIGADVFSSQIKSPALNIVVAVVDTGVYKDHPLLVNRMIAGYDFIDQHNDPNDLEGHGTHAAGIIANTAGSVPLKIMPIRVIGPNGGYHSDIGQGIRYAVDHGAHVVNLSLGGIGYSQY